MSLPADGLKGRRILLVEDEYFIADDLRRSLSAEGAAVLGPASTVAEALALVFSDGPIDGAILDINLHGEMIYPVADELTKRGVPFLFLTGYEARDLPSRFAQTPCCQKPAEMHRILAALQ